MATKPRYLEKFESADAIQTFTFPLRSYQWESRQGIRSALSRAVGASYSYNHFGYNPAAKEDATEVVRFVAHAVGTDLDDDIDEIRSVLYRIGKGKAFTIDSTGDRRWAWAQIANMPQLAFTPATIRNIPVILEFIRSSDWMAAVANTGSQTLNEAVENFTITNNGNAATEEVVFRIRSSSATGFHSGIEVLNQTNGHRFVWNRDATSVDDELKADCGANTTLFSDNNGSSYVSDWENVVLGSQQNPIFLLDPGANQIKVTDGGGNTPNAAFEWSFFDTFH